MNDEDAIVKYARICYGREDTDNKEGLISTLIRNGHTSVFEHSVFTFKIKCPIYTARQWMRHRIGSYTEKSLRYTKPEEYDVPSFKSHEMEDTYRAYMKLAYKIYELFLSSEKREDARAILPLSTMTEFYWTVNARSLMNFLTLRLDLHAQENIRSMANDVLNIFREKMPVTCRLFEGELKI
jgi:thymidylate synthase (FAD)